MALNKQAKMEFMTVVGELMPGGKPDYTAVVRYPMVSDLIAQNGRFQMHVIVVMLVRDLCASVNVVRNMNEGQMIETAGMLLDECGNFRLEDYVMLFAMAKRGQLPINDGRGLMDRIDVEVVGKLLDAYWLRRDEAGKAAQEQEVKQADNFFNDRRIEFAPAIAEGMTSWRKQLEEKLSEEQQAADEAMRRRRDRDVAGAERLLLIPALVVRLIQGKTRHSQAEIGLQARHAEHFEHELQLARQNPSAYIARYGKGRTEARTKSKTNSRHANPTSTDPATARGQRRQPLRDAGDDRRGQQPEAT